jgi:hypothetical protein
MTWLVLVNPEPKITTLVPTGPVVGVHPLMMDVEEEMTGGIITNHEN